MRVVVDTNVLISAIMKADSTSRHCVDWIQSQAVLLKSSETEEELGRVSSRPRLIPLLRDLEFIGRLTMILKNAEPVSITGKIRQCRDPGDDKFLELALNGKADVIVSGDRDLLDLVSFQNIPIFSPADFMQIFIRRK